jgi:hypothetical protein
MLAHPLMLGYASLGAFVHWVLLRYGGNVSNGLDNFVDELSAAFRPATLVKMGLFVILGSALAVIMVSPGTSRQALAAGMAWTTLVSRLGTDGQKADKKADREKG